MSLIVEGIKLKKNNTQILKGISCEFKPGIINGVIGVNGSGKSMFIKSIIKLEHAEGNISFNGSKLKNEDFSYIAQGSEAICDLSVYEVVLLGLYQSLGWSVSKEQMEKVDNVLNRLNLKSMEARNFQTLSGGQRQMVLLAQALVKETKIIFADEPTSALDLRNQLEYLSLLLEYTQKHNVITILILHDLSLISRYVEKIHIIENGAMNYKGDNKDILKKDILESVYGVDLEITETKQGFKSIFPISIKK